MKLLEEDIVPLSPGVQFSQESLVEHESGIPGNTVLGGGAKQPF